MSSTAKAADTLIREVQGAPLTQRFPLIVRLAPDAPQAKALMPSADVCHVYRARLSASFSLDATPEEARSLLRHRGVERVWRDWPVHINLSESAPLVEAPAVWKSGYTGKGVLLAVVDTGVDREHPDLKGRVEQFVDFTGRNRTDANGHGTHVAGICAGNGAAGQGKYVGLAPEARIIAARSLGPDGNGLASDVLAGLDWAVAQKAQVINLSLGSDEPSDGTDPLSLACDAAMQRGTVVCVAVGNTGPSSGTVGAPGTARVAICVGACTKDDKVAYFSARGPTLDGRVKPDILFPGTHIASCRANGTAIGQVVDMYYTRSSGTSMASPHAAGACCLLLQARPELTPVQVKQVLMDSAVSLGAGPNDQGAGRACLSAALKTKPRKGAEDQTGGSGCLPPAFYSFRR